MNGHIQLLFHEDYHKGIDFIFNYLGMPHVKITNLKSLNKDALFICQEKIFYQRQKEIMDFISKGGILIKVSDNTDSITDRLSLFKNLLSNEEGTFNIKYNIFEVFSILSEDQVGKFNSKKFKRTFPIDSLLHDLAGTFYDIICSITGPVFFKWFWPSDYESALVFSHDIDTEYGFNEGLLKFRELEKKERIKSIWFVRPGDRYELDSDKLKTLIDEGCEIGLHSINDAFKNKEELIRQKRIIEQKIDKKIYGVRNHCLVRDSTTPNIEKNAGFIYESNIPDTDNCVPNFSNRGSTFFYPYYLDGILVLPLTLHDWCFIAGNKYPDDKSMNLYLAKLDYIHKKNGLMTALFHSADYMTGKERIWMYEKFLNKIKNLKIWKALPNDIYNWTKEREKISFNIVKESETMRIDFVDGICSLAMKFPDETMNFSFYYENHELKFDTLKIGEYTVFKFKQTNI